MMLAIISRVEQLAIQLLQRCLVLSVLVALLAVALPPVALPPANAETETSQRTVIGDLWVMFYFGLGWGPGAFDSFSCSRDLVHWTQWDGDVLIQSSLPWDKTFAHKPWVLKHDGVVYHFYCAVGNQGRTIALATSKELRKQ